MILPTIKNYKSIRNDFNPIRIKRIVFFRNHPKGFNFTLTPIFFINHFPNPWNMSANTIYFNAKGSKIDVDY